MPVDRVRLQSLRNDLHVSPLSPKAFEMLRRIAEGCSPVILVRFTWPPDSPVFGDGLVPADEFSAAYHDLDQRGLVDVDAVVEVDERRDEALITLRPAGDLPERGLLAALGVAS